MQSVEIADKIDGRFDISNIGHTWLAQAAWIRPGESMVGPMYPNWRCFAGSRRRCKRFVERVRREVIAQAGRTKP